MKYFEVSFMAVVAVVIGVLYMTQPRKVETNSVQRESPFRVREKFLRENLGMSRQRIVQVYSEHIDAARYPNKKKARIRAKNSFKSSLTPEEYSKFKMTESKSRIGP